MATRAVLAELSAAYTAHGGVRVAIESVGGVDAARRVQAGEVFDLVVLASDAAHFYENQRLRKPFPIVVDLQDMLDGFATLDRLASHRDLIIPGHDPLVRQAFPRDLADHVSRLDRGPLAPILP